MICDHSAPHSGVASYLRETSQLRLALVCDGCGAEREEIGTIPYRPRGRRFAGHLAELTAREMGLSEAKVARVRFAALICDVGHDQMPPEILSKRGPLTDQEWEQVHRVPELGAALLSDTSFDDIREWILTRRERPDGRGYPRGLRGEQIPIEARILTVADSYLAMISHRAHRPARHDVDAAREIRAGAGTQFDVAVVDAFMRAWERRAPRLEAAA